MKDWSSKVKGGLRGEYNRGDGMHGAAVLKVHWTWH